MMDIKKLEKPTPKSTFRDGLYGGINMSVKAINHVILGLSMLLLALIVVGILL